MFLSKWAFNNSKACGVNDVRRFRFFDGSTPMKSVKWFWPLLYRFQWLEMLISTWLDSFFWLLMMVNCRKYTFLQPLSSIAPERAWFFGHFSGWYPIFRTCERKYFCEQMALAKYLHSSKSHTKTLSDKHTPISTEISESSRNDS